jgi:hypothetical protein
MTRLNLMLAAGAVSLAAATVAIAQQSGADPSTPAQPSAMPAQPSDQGMQGAPAAAVAGANVNATVAASPDTSGQVQDVRLGDSTTVTNGPVPDTPANRAKYGGPTSMTGKKTRPAGN